MLDIGDGGGQCRLHLVDLITMQPALFVEFDVGDARGDSLSLDDGWIHVPAEIGGEHSREDGGDPDGIVLELLTQGGGDAADRVLGDSVDTRVSTQRGDGRGVDDVAL